MRRSSGLLLLAVTCGVACSEDREFSPSEVAGTSGTGAGSGGTPSGSGGRSTASGGTSRGGAAGVSGAAVANGGASAGRSTGGSSGRGGTGATNSGGSDPEGGSGDDDSGGSSGSDGSGATSGTGAEGGSSGSSSSGGSDTVGGSSGTAAGGAGSSGAGAGGTSVSAGTGGTETAACDSQLLANANFDAGPTPSWQQETNVTGAQAIVPRTDSDLVAEQVTPDSGDFLAWLGGFEDDEFDHSVIVMRQDVTIPAEASMLTLSGRYWIKSLEPADGIYDVSYLEFEDEEGVAWQARGYSNLDVTSGWTSFESSTDDLTRLAGKTVTFVAYARTDFTVESSFFYDTLRLEASCGR